MTPATGNVSHERESTEVALTRRHSRHPGLALHEAVRPRTRLATRLSEQPWWTAADQAEVDALIDAFLAAVFDHRERGCACATGLIYCQGLRGAFEVVMEFRATRIRRSKAEWMREQLDLIEEERERRRSQRASRRPSPTEDPQ